MKDQKHAEMVKSWVKPYIVAKIPFEMEVPYNFFGERGFVDLVVHGNHYELLYEFKTQIDDLGETIRQFKRMATFYPKCSRSSFKPYRSMLILLDTPENTSIFFKYCEMFNGMVVCFYDPQRVRITYLKSADGQVLNPDGKSVVAPSRREGGS